MRIVLVNWAKVWDGAPVGGGVNGYVQALALEFAQRDHEVYYLCAGTQYTPDPQAPDLRPGPCMLRRHPDWLGIKVFEVVNSPVLAPATYQFRAPAAEVSAPVLESRIAEWITLVRPDAVHFHNIEGLTAGTLAAVRAAVPQAAVLYSLHNYHTICQQVYLMQHHLFPCHDDDNGRACENCIEISDPDTERRRRTREWASAVNFVPLSVAGAPPGRAAPAPSNGPRRALRRALGALARRTFGRLAALGAPAPPAAPKVPQPRPLPLPGFPVESRQAVEAPIPYPNADPRGQTALILGEISPSRTPGPGDPEWQGLTNDIRPPRPQTGEPNGYALRRRAMIAMLNSCDSVLAVSEFVREKFCSMGLDPAVVRTVHIGTKATRIAERSPELLFDPPPFDPAQPRPVRLVFMGYHSIFKGLPMVADALELLTPEVLSRFHLSLHAQALEAVEWRFRRLESRLAGLTIGPGYHPHDIPRILSGKDLGIVPSIWWDNAPQTVFEFFSCRLPVLGADVGGIPDFVREGHNGLLFRANDRYDLARRLAGIARDPALLFRLRANVRPPKDIAVHALELEDLYRECRSRRGAGRPSVEVKTLAGAGVSGLPAT